MFWSYLTEAKQKLCQNMEAFESPVELKRLHLTDVQWDRLHDAWDCKGFIPPVKKQQKLRHFILSENTKLTWYKNVSMWQLIDD